MGDSLDVSPCQAENVPNFLLRPDVRGTKPAAEGMRVLAAPFFAINLGDAVTRTRLSFDATPPKYDCKRAACHWAAGISSTCCSSGRR